MKFLMYSDCHFRSTVPVCRLDDYWGNQDKLLKWLNSFEEYTHLNAGDIVNSARERKAPVSFVNYLIQNFPKSYGVLGNHDLLEHSIKYLYDTTLGSLILSGKFNVIDTYKEFDDVAVYGFSYGQEMKAPSKKNANIKTYIALYHGLVVEKYNPLYGDKAVLASDLLNNFPDYDIILTGDNHTHFTVVQGDRVLINPGSLKRDSADQIDHVPYIYTFDSDSRKVDRIPVPIENDIISREHIQIEKDKDERIMFLSDKFQEVKEVTLDFKDNLREFLLTNEVNPESELLISGWME